MKGRIYRLDEDGQPTGEPWPVELSGLYVEGIFDVTDPPVELVHPDPIEFELDLRDVDHGTMLLLFGHPWWRCDFDALVTPRLTRLLRKLGR